MTIAVMMGVSGSGKTTIAAASRRAKAGRCSRATFHPPANVAKMAPARR